jgi:putative integral membrane protein (TIGR02587 family)
MAFVENNKPIRESLQEYGRGITGGLLFSFPLLYTMEVWWAGFIAPPFALLVLVSLTFLILLGYNRFAGMRPDATWREVAIDSVEEMGIGLMLAFAVLLMLNRIHIGSMGIDEMMGKVVIEAMFVSIGVSVGTAQLGAGSEGGKGNEEQSGDEKDPSKNNSAQRTSKLGIAVLALCGSILVGGNVAPTEEVLMIAVEAEPIHILMMVLTSLFLSIVITFFSDFKGSFRRKPENFLYHLVFDTCICYLVALGASAFVLWFFGRFDNMSFWNVFAEVITLGVLSTVGASAGRLLIK